MGVPPVLIRGSPMGVAPVGHRIQLLLLTHSPAFLRTRDTGRAFGKFPYPQGDRVVMLNGEIWRQTGASNLGFMFPSLTIIWIYYEIDGDKDGEIDGDNLSLSSPMFHLSSELKKPFWVIKVGAMTALGDLFGDLFGIETRKKKHGCGCIIHLDSHFFVQSR